MTSKKKLTTKSKKIDVEDLDLDERVVREWKYLRKIYIKDEDHLLFASFIIVLVGLIVLFTLFITSRVPEVQKIVVSNKDSAPTKVLNSEQTATSSAYTVSIKNVTQNAAPDKMSPLPDNYTMLIMDMTLTNNSAGTQTFIPSTQLFARARDGRQFPFQMSMYATNPVKFQELKPGESQTGQISFAVPKDLSDPLLYVDLGWDNYVPVVFSPLN